MLNDSLDAFVARDTDLAMQVCIADDFEDTLNPQIFDELLLFVQREPKNSSRAVLLTYITKYLERIADHANEHSGNGRIWSRTRSSATWLRTSTLATNS